MRAHFFTINDIEDYRKNYRDATEKNLRRIEELEQEHFIRMANSFPCAPEGILESELYGETGFEGLKLDFNFGLRLDVPEGNFHVKVSDFDTGKVFFDNDVSGGRLFSVERYFIRWHVEISLDGKKIFTHTLDLEGQPVAIRFISDALGDMLALLPYLREFKKIHNCDLYLFPHDDLRELAAHLYPDIPLIDKLDSSKTYATYYLAMITAPTLEWPVDTRRMSMTRIGGTLLGINYLPPKAVFEPTEPPVTNEPYVCIGIQARNARKSWHWPDGWDIVVNYLKSLGYRVFCIDKNAEQTNDGFNIRKPEGAEDFTGERPLLERANMLYHAEFFIGLGSGLSWLADAVGCPVVMICGFSQDWCEFYTPYRVANRRVCNGCLNDVRTVFFDSLCPYHKNTPREMECQKKIPPSMVIDAIERLILEKNLIPPVISIGN